MPTKCLLIISLASAVLCTAGMAVVPGLAGAVALRVTSGLTNSLSGAFKSNVAQAFHKSDQGTIFGVTMGAWAVGSMLGSAVAGVLSYPCETLPWLAQGQACAGAHSLLRRFPFFLPWLLLSFLCALAAVVVGRFLHVPDDVKAAYLSADMDDGRQLECPDGDGDRAALLKDGRAAEGNDAERVELFAPDRSDSNDTPADDVHGDRGDDGNRQGAARTHGVAPAPGDMRVCAAHLRHLSRVSKPRAASRF